MFSDSLSECMHNILIAVRDYDYVDDRRDEIIKILISINNLIHKYNGSYEYTDDKLDKVDLNFAEKDQKKILKSAIEKFYDEAVKKRDTDDENFYVD